MKRRLVFAIAILSLAVIGAACSTPAPPETDPVQQGGVSEPNPSGEESQVQREDRGQGGTQEGREEPGGESQPPASSRPQTKEESIAIEGMPEKHTFTLHVDPALGLSAYIIDDMVAESVSSGEGDALMVYFNTTQEKNPKAMFSLFSPAEGQGESLEEHRKRWEEKLQGQGLKIVEEKGSREIEIGGIATQQESVTLQTQGGETLFGSVAFFARNGRVYQLLAHYPPEFGDGFGPRYHQFIQDVEWLP